MKKTKTEIENEKFWNDFFKTARQIRKNAIEEEIQQKEEERKQQISKKGFFSGFQGSQTQQRSEKIPYQETYAFQTSNFEENNGVKAIFKRISSATTTVGAGRTGNYIGRISDEKDFTNLFYRGYCGTFDEEGNEQLEEINTYNNENKAFLNSCFEEEILRMSPTLGNGSEIESHHYIFSIPEYTRTLNNKVVTKNELNRILEQATINTIKSNEILKARAVEMAVHQENHAHLNFSATNFDGEKDLKFITKKQQMDILRDFSRECRNLGLNIEIPRENSPILNLQELNTITSIEYKQNNQIKAITLQNSKGATKRLMAVSVNDFVVKNNLKINDKIAIEIQKNQYGRNFYSLIDRENSKEEEPPKIKVSEQKIELNSLQIAEAQRQIQEEQEEKEKREREEQEESLQNVSKSLKKAVFYSENLKNDKNIRRLNKNNIKTKINLEKTIKEMSKMIKDLRNKNAKEIERILNKKEIER